MEQKLITTILLSTFIFSLFGCVTSPSRGVELDAREAPQDFPRVPEARDTQKSIQDTATQTAGAAVAKIQLVAHQEEVPQPHGHSELMVPPVVTPEEIPPLTLQDLEGMAMVNNPTLVQANAQFQGEQGAAYQAGLWFNPVVGYTSEQIGVNGTAGETQGGYVTQEIVTGGKLRLSRAKWAQRAQIAATIAQAQQQRVLNDVQTHFYRTLAAQRLVEIHRKFVANGEDNVQTHREMLNLGQTTASAILQAEVELRRDQLNLKDAENDLHQAWRTLVALVGCPQLASTRLEDMLAATQEPLDYELALGQLLSSSPELVAARQKIQHDQIQLERERVQPIPNVLVDARVGRNFEAGGQTTAGVNVGLPIPLFDRNRGTIQQAQADLTRSHADARRLELELQTRLAAEYRAYLSAWQRVDEYQATMLPKAEEASELLRKSYYDPKMPENRRALWVDVLAAQRLHMTLETEYVGSLKNYHEADVAIRGMLLTGGLTEPPAAVGGGHIDATPKPR
ncbi:TolC family protein [bacterium]|nr:TolC family protein [bacterium]